MPATGEKAGQGFPAQLAKDRAESAGHGTPLIREFQCGRRKAVQRLRKNRGKSRGGG